MNTIEWAKTMDPADVDLSILAEIIRCDENRLYSGLCHHIEETKEELRVLKDLMKRAEDAQRKGA